MEAGNGPSLVGHDWLTSIQLDWNELFYTHHDSTHLQKVLNKYPRVFENELG
jgi:hypothetical protein